MSYAPINGALDGTRTHTLPADNGLLFYSATRAKWPALKRWWEVLVTLQFVASDTLFSDSRFTVGRPDHLPCIENAEVRMKNAKTGDHQCLFLHSAFILLPSNWWSRWVTLPHQ